jgi:hypothetical protein
MICEAVHATLLPRDRKRLHSQAADILRAGYAGTPDATPDMLAEHLRVAERWVECIETHLAASTDTAAAGAYVESEGHCEAALTLIDRVESLERRRELQFKLQIQLGVALTGKYGYASPRVENAYRAAQSVCGEGAEAEELYPIMRGLATVNLVRGNLAMARDLSEQGLLLAERCNRPKFRIDAMTVQCYTTLYHGRLADCRVWIERCLALYREERGEQLTYPVPQDAATAALALLPTVAWLVGDAEAAEHALSDGLAHVERLSRDGERALLHAWSGSDFYVTPDTIDAIMDGLIDRINAEDAQATEQRDPKARGACTALDNLSRKVAALRDPNPRAKGDDDGVEYADPRDRC